MSMQGRSIVALPAPGYQELELWYPVLRSREESATVTIVADGALESHLGYPVLPHVAPSGVDPATVDAVVIPGVVTGSPAYSESQLTLLAAAVEAGAVIAAIGASAQALAASQVGTRGNQILTADTPDDLPALVKALSDALARVAR